MIRHKIWSINTQQTPRSLTNAAFKAQSVAQIDKLKHAGIGGEIEEDGKESIKALNYNAEFTYAVKAIQELHEIVKLQQIQIDELKAKL